MMENGGAKKLVDLRVVDLRNELEKRSLEKTGNKAVLSERLQKALLDEGLDSETYLFETPGTLKSCKKEKGDGDDEFLDMEDEQEDEKTEDEPLERDGLEDSCASYGDLEVMDTLDTSESVHRSPQAAEKESLAAKTEVSSLKKEDTSGQASSTPPGVSKVTVLDAAGRDAKVKEEDMSLVVHVDESEENLDYDLDKKGSEAMVVEEVRRDAPTPTKDENIENADSKSDQAAKPAGTESAAASQGANDADAKTPTKSNGTDAKKITLPVKTDIKDVASIRNLWISGLSSNTKATDLKAAFSKCGKVVGAKVVTNAKKPGARCYGFVTMSTAEEATKCIQHLNKTELHGRVISIEKAKSDPAAQARAATKRLPAIPAVKPQKTAVDTPKAAAGKKEEPKKDALRKDEKPSEKKVPDKVVVEEKKEPKVEVPKKAAVEVKPVDRKEEPKDESKDKRPEIPVKKDEVKPVVKQEESKEEKLRRQELMMREDERRKRAVLLRDQRRLVADSRRVRDEQIRVDREKDRIRMEREKLQIERNEVMRLEREKQRLDRELRELREKCDMEREELKRLEQTRIEEQRKAQKRTYDSRNGPRDEPYWNEPKRQATEDRFGAPTAERYNRPDVRPVDGGGRSFSAERRVVDRYDRRVDGRTNEAVSPVVPRKEPLPVRDHRDARRIVEERDREPPVVDRFSSRRPDEAYHGGSVPHVERRAPGPMHDPIPVDRNDYTERRQAPRDRGDRSDWKEAERGSLPAHRDAGANRSSQQWPSESRSSKNWPQSGSGDRSWSGGSAGAVGHSGGLTGGLIGNTSQQLFSGASAQAANMVMNASRGQDRFTGSGTGGGGFSGRRY